MTERVVKQHLSQFAPKQKSDERTLTGKKVDAIISRDKGDNIITVVVFRTDVAEYHKHQKAYSKVTESVAQIREESPTTEILFKTFVPGHSVELSDMQAPEGGASGAKKS